MTAASFGVLWIFSRGINFKQLLKALAVAAALIGIGLLTGRRKVVVEFAVFVGTYFILWVMFERGVGKLANIALIGVTLLGCLWLASGLRERVPERHDQGIVKLFSALRCPY